MSTDDELLARALAENGASDPELLDAAKRIFEYTRFLLDVDDNLTKTGALNGGAREQLRKRIVEVIGDVPHVEPRDDDDDDDDAGDDGDDGDDDGDDGDDA